MIRIARKEDLPEILTIYNDAILHTTAVYSYKAQTLANREQWFEEKQANNFPILVYELEGRVVGFATYGPFRAWPAYKYSVEHSIYVDSNYRKNGIGRQLLTALIEDATAREYKTIIAGIDAENVGSIAIHEKFGFKHAGTMHQVGYKFNRWLDLAFYQLQLKGPENPTEQQTS